MQLSVVLSLFLSFSLTLSPLYLPTFLSLLHPLSFSLELTHILAHSTMYNSPLYARIHTHSIAFFMHTPHMYDPSWSTVPTPTVALTVPSGPLYEGTSQTQTCSASLPASVNTPVSVSVHWAPDLSSDDIVTISPSSAVQSPFTSTLTLSPLARDHTGQYSCEVTVSSSSQYIITSSPGQSSQQTLTVSGE